MISSSYLCRTRFSFEVRSPECPNSTFLNRRRILLVFHDSVARTWNPGSPSSQYAETMGRRPSHSWYSRRKVRPGSTPYNPHLKRSLLLLFSIGDQFARWTSTLTYISAYSFNSRRELTHL